MGGLLTNWFAIKTRLQKDLKINKINVDWVSVDRQPSVQVSLLDQWSSKNTYGHKEGYIHFEANMKQKVTVLYEAKGKEIRNLEHFI